MENLKICKMNDLHRLQISLWGLNLNHYNGDIFEDNFYPSSGFVNHLVNMKFLKNHWIYEKDYYVLQNEKGKVVSFVEIHIRNDEKHNAYIAGIYTHPKLKNNGYGTYLLENILAEPEKYMSVIPEEIVALVKKNNKYSMKMFEHLATLKKNYYGLGFMEIRFNLKDFQTQLENKQFLM